MTEKLYDKNAYTRDFESKVISCEPTTRVMDNEEIECFKVILEGTCFFPEEGGQTSDHGFFGVDNEVFDVQLLGDEIFHYCKKSVLPGDIIEGHICWEHRFNNMQQHTGEHIFTGLAHTRFGATNVGFHLSDNVVTLDLDVALTKDQVKELEEASNQVISQGKSIRAWYPDAATLKSLDYRSKAEIEGLVRIVEIEDTDKCACCAPHVKNTSEVGCLKVQSFSNYKGGVRVSILCGLRAVKDYGSRMELLEETFHLLNCPQVEIPSRVRVLMEENKALKYKFSQLNAKALLNQIEVLEEDTVNPIIFTDTVEQKIQRDAVNSLVSRYERGICGIFAGDDESGYAYIIGSATKNCKIVAGTLKEKLMAKGGGSDRMIQGSLVATKEDILREINGCNI